MSRVLLQNVKETATSYILSFHLQGIPISIVQVEGEGSGSFLWVRYGRQLAHKVELSTDANVDAATATWYSSSSTLNVTVPKMKNIKYPYEQPNKPKMTVPPRVPISRAR
ncbi:hypothetical protein KP509_20G080700 [Ceratopteris richardii]|uniref:Uncharacterized protein n=1 Tax=Ceratopteris richardii TaxID=49495 RepID=A0A8T2SIH9_CERRI|nr:hypothetical protein KP509_20G080700 [Ceratopteris richardii]